MTEVRLVEAAKALKGKRRAPPSPRRLETESDLSYVTGIRPTEAGQVMRMRVIHSARLRGYLNINGVEFWVSGWERHTRSGDRMIQLRVEPKQARDARATEPKREDLDDDIRFRIHVQLKHPPGSTRLKRCYLCAMTASTIMVALVLASWAVYILYWLVWFKPSRFFTRKF